MILIPFVSKEQIEKAKEWDVLSYLQTYAPSELVKCGPHEYCTRAHDSLKISNGKWCWNSRGIGGRTALDYLIKVDGLPFVRAVEVLCGSSPPPAPPAPAKEESAPFVLPQASLCPAAMVSYLQRRGIDAEIISVCMSQGILYESKQYHNCVFVGQDPTGIARYASLRGTKDSFKIDVPGSDKRYNFCLFAADNRCDRLAVAESAIDALSLATLVKRSHGNWRNCNYLSLGGTAPHALIRFLSDYPQITDISLCLDNDAAGMTGMGHLEQAVREDNELSPRIKLIYHNPPAPDYGKDYNELLCAQIKIEKAAKSISRVETR